MTVKELREVLFYIHNQKMTIEELRARLFTVENQDAELVHSFAMWIVTGVEVVDNDNH